MTTLPNDRIQRITAEVAGAFRAIVEKDTTRKDASDALKEYSADATSTREGTLVTLAAMADADQWSPDDVLAGVDAATAQRNDKLNSLATFGGEIRQACHPSVRAHVADMFKLATEAWDAEGEQTAKDAKKPLRKAFQRKYHLVVGRMFKAAVAGKHFATTQELTAFAIENDPDLDYTKVFNRLGAIKAQLAAFANDFPVDGLQECVKFLGAVTKDELKACREDEPVTTPAPAAQTHEAVEGAAGDILDEALADISA